MPPSIGRIVIIRHPGSRYNGTEESPAIVTRVWGPEEYPMINVTMFPDCHAAVPKTSIGHVSKYPDMVMGEGTLCWDWPQRV